MKKRVVTLILLGILLLSPLVLAQEQSQTYSGFNRFIDNVKFFFSSGDGKIQLALEVREKELTSAIINTKKGDNQKAEKNLERAKEKLQYVQSKVSKDTAEEVKTSSEKTVKNIKEEKDLLNTFETYILEEEKTQLTAELVVEVEGKEGQALKREIVKDSTTGKKMVKIVVDLDDGKQRIIELEEGIAQLENQIAKKEIAERVIKTEIATGDGGLKPEVKTHVEGDGTEKNDPLPEPDLNKINPDLYDPNARAPGDTIDETYDDDLIESGDCGDGVDCGDGSPGVEGVNEAPAPAVDSNEGDV